MDPAYGDAAAALDAPEAYAGGAQLAPDADGPPAPDGADVVAFVQAQARRMEYDHAMTLLEGALGAGAFRSGRLRVRPRASPVFAASDIERIDVGPDGAVTAEVTFLGLYGPTPALPAYITEPIAHDEADGLRGFLDVFNGRLYRLYHEAWRKYRPRARFSTDAAGEAQAPEADANPFVALAGVPPGTGAVGLPFSPLRLVALAGRLGTRVRNAPGLRDLLTHFIGLPVAIEENHPRWVVSPARQHVGAPGDAGLRLGLGALLGGRIYDVSGKARVVFGPLDIDDYRSLLPGGARAATAAGLIGFYLPDGLDYDVQLLLRERQSHALVLGAGASHLGRNAWVGSTGSALVSEVVSYN